MSAATREWGAADPERTQIVRRRRPPRPGPVGCALIVGLLAFLLTLGWVLSRPKREVTGFNGRAMKVYALIAAGTEACQPGEWVPRDSQRVSVLVNTIGRPGPPLTITARSAAGRVVTRAQVPGGYRTRKGFYSFGTFAPLVPVPRSDASDVDVCVANRGRNLIEIYGGPAPPGAPLRNTSGGTPTQIFLQWYSAGPRRWWSVAPHVARRAALEKSPLIRPWTIWAAFGLVGLLGALALAWVVREARR